MRMTKIRLYLDAALSAGQAVTLNEAQANYLFNVMRLGPGDGVLLFNGRQGEWLATIAQVQRRSGVLLCAQPTAPQHAPPDLWLLFAPLKKPRTDMLVEKAVELGAARLCPVQTQHSQPDRLRRDKMLAHAIEAAEQCGATHIPQIDDLAPLPRLLATWPKTRLLFWADEALAGAPCGAPSGALTGPRGTPSALLIGPEGGFSDTEKTQLRALPFVRPISLGPRILRAETAAIAALTLWQASMGDWDS